MNEKIKELAKQANIHFSRVGILDGDPKGSARLVGYSKMEKFAELIVRECIQVSGPEDSYTDEWFKAKIDSVQKIKKHFGVEE